MKKRFSRALFGLCVTALVAAIVWVACAHGEASRTAALAAERAASLREVKLVSEFMATNGFSEAPESVLRSLAADCLPLAQKFRAKLNTTTLDANGTEEAVAKMLVSIAGDPASNEQVAEDAGLKDILALRTVFQCTMFGVGYGRFTALRRGVTEDSAVDGMVTAYASATLDGLIAFLAELPQPETPTTTTQPQPTPPDAPQAPPETPGL
jgi:hypothetical protein